MRKQRGEASSGGIGVFGLLGVIFIVLKVLEIAPVASWSWWWVTLPFWGGFVVIFLVFLVIGVMKFRA